MASRPTRPTQRDVAERASVSTATVSYILSGRRGYAKPVSDETRDRVLRAASALGYRRNHMARSLRRRRTDLVCVVHELPSSPWLEHLIEQFHETAVRHGCAVITLPVTAGDRDTALRVLGERYVDGAVVAPNCRFPAGELGQLARAGLALMVFDDDLAPRGFDVIRQGQEPACYAAVEHLVRAGHRRIAYLGQGTDLATARGDVRYAAYRDALADGGVELDDSLVVPAADSRVRAHEAVTHLLARRDRPTAIFSATDRAALQSLWVARDLGLSVPSDLAVVGVGNTDEGATVNPSLTSVGIPSFDFTVGIDRLFDRITSTAARRGKELHLPWELIVRKST